MRQLDLAVILLIISFDRLSKDYNACRFNAKLLAESRRCRPDNYLQHKFRSTSQRNELSFLYIVIVLT